MGLVIVVCFWEHHMSVDTVVANCLYHGSDELLSTVFCGEVQGRKQWNRVG